MEIKYRRVKTRDYFIDEYGVLWVAERLRVESPDAGTPLEHVSEGEDSPNPESPEAQDVPPEEWLFDDHSQNVTIGKQILHFQGEIQYRLLKYAAQGGVNLQEAWKVAWGYESQAEWRTVQKAADQVSKKLTSAQIPWKVDSNTQVVKIFKRVNTGSQQS